MSSNPERFGSIVRDRRLHLEMSQVDLWQAGGPSNTKLTEIENGHLEKLTPATARKIDAGLLWEPGSARRAWEGGDPSPLERGGRRDERWLREQIDEAEISSALRARLLAVLDRREASG